MIEDRENYLHQWVKRRTDVQQEDIMLKRLKLFDVLPFIAQQLSPKKAIYFYFTHDEINALKNTKSDSVGYAVSRNDALCANILFAISRCRDDNPTELNASVVINYRNRISMPNQALGNYIDTIPIKFNKNITFDILTDLIHERVKNYHHGDFRPLYFMEFIKNNGGMKNVNLIIPNELLPKKKNLVITNWSNFDVYSIDFGLTAPFLFLPIGSAPSPWLSWIVEGFHKKGNLVSLILPTKLATRLTEPKVLEEIHQYRKQISPEEAAILQNNSWLK
jgi:hypothetical protein